MATGIDPNRIDRYILEADRKLPKEKQTVFLLKPLRHSVKSNLIDGQTLEKEGKFANPITFVTLLAQHGIAGWENFRTVEGKEIPFIQEGNKASDESLSSLLFDDLNELAGRILDLSGLTEVQKKK